MVNLGTSHAVTANRVRYHFQSDKVPLGDGAQGPASWQARAGPWATSSFPRRRKGFGPCGITRTSGVLAPGSSHAAVIESRCGSNTPCVRCSLRAGFFVSGSSRSQVGWLTRAIPRRQPAIPY